MRSLKQKKYRREYQSFVIEGVRSIQSAIDDNVRFESVFLSSDFEQDRIPELKKMPSNIIHDIPQSTMKKISSTSTSSGVLAVTQLPKYKEFSFDENAIYLDGISDPGNMGTILRTASWFGVKQIILSKGCIDPFNAKVVSSAMGAHFQLNFLDSLSLFDLSGYKIIGTSSTGTPINEYVDINDKWVLVMGSEAHGISDSIDKLITDKLAIPKNGKGESLNVGVAMGIFLYYLVQ